AFRAWLQARDVGGCRWTVTQLGLAEPFLMRADSPWIQTVRNAVLGETGRPPALVREGATIPVGADLQKTLGLDVLFVGFGLNSDGIHGPDEHIDLPRLHLGARTLARLIAEVAAAR
ncbi:MAG: M20/M25/M40 family metallo-hydrolase, partial [Planctomycetota bacterium]